jgi:16S rRNA (uracil1498-N3)-methyltransferase
MSVRLSNIELYYSSVENISDGIIKISGEEYKHSVKVMRAKIGDEMYITNGTGSIFRCEVLSIVKENLTAKVKDQFNYENKLKNIYFCIPKLKNPERFKFALEKCVELGVVNFIVFESERTISKGCNIKRWENIALAAMKQSIRSYLPNIKVMDSFTEIIKLSGEKIVFDQNAQNKFEFKDQKHNNYYFIFGPEGGLTGNELKLFEPNERFSISENRLRSETAIIKAASLLE